MFFIHPDIFNSDYSGIMSISRQTQNSVTYTCVFHIISQFILQLLSLEVSMFSLLLNTSDDLPVELQLMTPFGK